MEYRIDVESNLGLVHLIANQMRGLIFNGAVDYDDLVQDGVLGLIHAVKHFDPDQGFKFSSYAGQCIRGSMLQGSRTLFKERWKARKAGISSVTISTTDAEGKVVIGMTDHGDNAKWMFENAWRSEILGRIRKALTFRQRRIMDLLIGHGLDQAAVAAKLETSSSSVSLCYRDSIKWAQKHFTLQEAA